MDEAAPVPRPARAAEDARPPSDRRRPGVPPMLESAAAVAWRVLVVAAAVLAVLYLIQLLRIVVFPLVIAAFLTTVLVPVVHFLVGRGVPNLLAVWLAMLGFLSLLIGAGFLVVPATIDQFSDLGPTLQEGIDDIQEWFVEGPLELEPGDVQRYRERISEGLSDLASTAGRGSIASGARLAGEILAGILLSFVMTFFLVKDRDEVSHWLSSLFPGRHQGLAHRIGERSWTTLGAFIRGTALLGLIESTIIGTAMFLVGSELVIPVMILTFFAAFIPFVGAITAGVIAVLVTLVAAGLVEAVIIAGVALLVQQLDGDILAPIILGRAVSLHPLAIILAVTAGGTVAGLAGAFIAVPLLGVIIVIIEEVRRDNAAGPTVST